MACFSPEWFKSVDQFSTSSVIPMDRNVSSVKSITGFACTILMFTIVGAFSYLKVSNLIFNNDIVLSRSPSENYYDD